jgi:hypothetical protein
MTFRQETQSTLSRRHGTTQPAVPFRGFLGKLIGFVLSEEFLGFLAIVAVALMFVPAIFHVGPAVDHAVAIGQWVIVALFAAEYAISFHAAPSKKAFLTNGWRLVDLATIVLPLLTALPGVSRWLRSSLMLRLPRLVRVVSLGLRATGVVRRRTLENVVERVMGPLEVSVQHSHREPAPRPASWEEFLQWVKAPGPDWYHATNLGTGALDELARTVERVE